MRLQIIKKLNDVKNEKFIEVYATIKNEICFLVDKQHGIFLDIETAEMLLSELKKEIKIAKNGGKNG
jgi:hypothetical protein